MPKLLVESTAVPVATGKEGRWRAVLITPGQGSSGYYSEAMLREYGPKALKAGAKSFVTHNRMPNNEPDPFSMWGFLVEDAVYEEGVGLVGEIEVLPSWRERIAEVAPHTALSVYTMGDKDAEDNVTALHEAVDNGVDLVVHPGRPGSGLVEKLYEAAKASADDAENGTAPAGRNTEMKESNMEIAELAGKVDKLNESVNSLLTAVTPILESLKPATVETPEVADLSTVAEAAVKAGIPEEMRSEIYSTVKDMPLAEALVVVEKRKALVESIAKQIRESAPAAPTVGAGRVVEGAEPTGFSLSKLAEVK